MGLNPIPPPPGAVELRTGDGRRVGPDAEEQWVEHLKGLYVDGEIDLDEFEARLDRLFAGEFPGLDPGVDPAAHPEWWRWSSASREYVPVREGVSTNDVQVFGEALPSNVKWSAELGLFVAVGDAAPDDAAPAIASGVYP